MALEKKATKEPGIRDRILRGIGVILARAFSYLAGKSSIGGGGTGGPDAGSGAESRRFRAKISSLNQRRKVADRRFEAHENLCDEKLRKLAEKEDFGNDC